jgi:hypothetical protein
MNPAASVSAPAPSVNVTAPETSTMDRSHPTLRRGLNLNLSYETEMSIYHAERQLFQQSPYRKCCAKLGHAALCAGCLGCLVLSPVVAPKVAWDWTALTMILTNISCCIGAGCCYDEADMPQEPDNPNSRPVEFGNQ